MNTLQLLCSAILGLMTLRVLSNIYMLNKNISWLRSYDMLKTNKTASTQFIVCIPALNEQETITSTLDNLLELDYPSNQLKLCVTTTDKEVYRKGHPTTYEIVRSYRNKLSQEKANQLFLFNYPKRDGRMAHQINFAAQQFRKELQKSNTYFIVYNADSQVTKDTLKVADTIITSSNPTQPAILQQSSVYRYEIGKNLTLKTSIALAAALHQTLWSLTHEISRTRAYMKTRLRHSRQNKISVLSLRNAHCVGHGIFINGPHFLIYPFPEDILNEDLAYSLMQGVRKTPIVSLPTLEVAASPLRPYHVYRQKSVWFNPFFEFHKCAQSILKKDHEIRRIELYVLLTHMYLNMLVWLLHSFVWIGSFILSLMSGRLFLLIWMLIFMFYWIVPSLLYKAFARERGLPDTVSTRGVLLGVAYVLTHSIGPLWCVVRWTIALAQNTKPDKPKTESA